MQRKYIQLWRLERCRNSELEKYLNFLIVPSPALCQNSGSVCNICYVASHFLKYNYKQKLSYTKMIFILVPLVIFATQKERKSINLDLLKFWHRKGFILLPWKLQNDQWREEAWYRENGRRPKSPFKIIVIIKLFLMSHNILSLKHLWDSLSKWFILVTYTVTLPTFSSIH